MKTEKNITKCTIVLWKISNRMSSLKSWDFIEKFFNSVALKHTVVKKKSKNNARLNYSFDLHDNTEILRVLLGKLPEPELRITAEQYILTYNFYKFRLEIGISVYATNTIYKITDLLENQWQEF